MIKLLKDFNLLTEIRTAAASAFETTETGQQKLSTKKLTELPLFQSFYMKILQLHVAINVTRQATEGLIINGYEIKKGYLV
jgi:hypothetical protein